MPTCCVKHEPGDEWNKDKKSYSSYNVAYQAHGTRWEADSLEDRPLEFRVGMGINLRPAGSEKPLPKISFVNRHQVLIWVSDPESKSRIRGIVVLMNSYLDNICTKDKLSILEEEEIELGPGTISLSIAQVQKEEARSPNKLRAAVTTSLTRFGRRPSATQISLPDVPPYEYLARGWDATNNEWRSVLWPALDKYFRAADLEETPPVWRIQCPWKKARTTVGGNVTP
ncbi:hypothetical protein K438DRAFT_913270 [Mycena galopus ATCC 62051]|nr:hypothetical protein K438DRAFT_913270 [Mycena galopus ATCC 62051]